MSPDFRDKFLALLFYNAYQYFSLRGPKQKQIRAEIDCDRAIMRRFERAG